MSSAERQKIYKKAGRKLIVWDESTLDCLDDQSMVQAFVSYVTQHKNGPTATVWDLLRKGTLREKSGESTDEIRTLVRRELSDGLAYIPSNIKEDFDQNVALTVVFDKLNEEFGSDLIEGFKVEISEYRKAHKSTEPSASERFHKQVRFQ
ncbi:Hypothetical predicted protein [Cloeon dipterum]|uniref:Uncharacterized protein n=1 Tax=Cloeon dipterum TaxID=197152 RepID=A0A8S1CK39_9INSE|nr:Hypothetical predicted protein [Cloeon dipterum]